MSRMRPLLALLFAAILLAAGCRTSGADAVVPAGGSDSVTPVRTVDPDVDRWFRDVRAAAATTFVPGDVVRIELKNLPEYSVDRILPPDGSIPLVRARRVVTGTGKTAQELEAEVASVYAEDLEAYVTVTLLSAAPRSVYVTGAVRNPQQIELTAGEQLDVLQALTRAGGPTDDADLYGVTVMRRHPTRGKVSSAPLDLYAVQDTGDQTDNLTVLPGDTIVVPEATVRQVHVLGHVVRPGPIIWRRGMTLSGAISEAGGFGNFPALGGIVVVRADGTRLSYDYDSYLDGALAELVLNPGDTIYVEERLI